MFCIFRVLHLLYPKFFVILHLPYFVILSYFASCILYFSNFVFNFYLIVDLTIHFVIDQLLYKGSVN